MEGFPVSTRRLPSSDSIFNLETDMTCNPTSIRIRSGIVGYHHIALYQNQTDTTPTEDITKPRYLSDCLGWKLTSMIGNELGYYLIGLNKSDPGRQPKFTVQSAEWVLPTSFAR
jgi:hypothetical protein